MMSPREQPSFSSSETLFLLALNGGFGFWDQPEQVGSRSCRVQFNSSSNRRSLSPSACWLRYRSDSLSRPSRPQFVYGSALSTNLV
jgi:hypothetical protein